jgi:diguanylate cyclase (GGDEF)-like protein
MMQPLDVLYLLVRAALALLSLGAAALTLRYALVARALGRPWRTAGVGGALLSVAAVLSLHDAIDNVVLRPHDPIPLASWFWLFGFDILLPFWALLLIHAWRQRDRAQASLERLTVTDPLTGALNRRGFFEQAATAIAQARRRAMPAAVIMFDIDRFKTINDKHGHDAGDVVLRAFTAIIGSGLRAGDLLGRMGGEEFALLLPASSSEQALATAERLRACVRTDVIHPGGAEEAVTTSAGVAAISGSDRPEAALSAALGAADAALFAAKRAGRDRAVIAPGVPSIHLASASN